MTTVAKLTSDYTLRFPSLAAILPMKYMIHQGSHPETIVKALGGSAQVPAPNVLEKLHERDLNGGILITAIMYASQMDTEDYYGRIQSLLADVKGVTAIVPNIANPVNPAVLALVLSASALTNVFTKTLGSTNSVFTAPYFNMDSDLEELLARYYTYCNSDENKEINDNILFASSFIRDNLNDMAKIATTLCKLVDFNEVYARSSESRTTDGSRGMGTCIGQFKGRTSTFLGIQIAELAATLLRTNRVFLEQFKGMVRGHQFSLEEALVDYESTLRGKYEGMFKSDHSYARPNKRYMFTGVIMPSMISNSVKLAFAVDHSGSISCADSAQQLGVIDAVLNKHPNHITDLMAFDTVLHGSVRLESGDRLMDALGRLGETVGGKGGTDFACIFSELEKREDLAELNMITVISADGCGGDLNLSQHFKNTFKGKILFVFHNDSTGKSSAKYYENVMKGQFQFETILYNRNKQVATAA